MKTLTIKIKKAAKFPIETEVIKAESFTGLSLIQIKDLTVYSGNKEEKLGDFFSIEGEIAKNPESQKIILEGDYSKVRRIGEAMKAGEIIIKGNVDLHLGENLGGGKITVEGDVAGWVGTNMIDGLIHIKGDVDCYVGCAERGMGSGMSGGAIIVDGDVGLDVGRGLKGGEITVGGKVKRFIGAYMKAGVIKAREAGEHVGYAMSGGQIMIETPFDVPFYFKKTGEEGEQVTYEGDISFNAGGTLKIPR